MKFNVWIVNKKYVGQPSHSINEWIYEHTRDFKKGNKECVFVKYDLETNQKFSFNN